MLLETYGLYFPAQASNILCFETCRNVPKWEFSPARTPRRGLYLLRFPKRAKKSNPGLHKVSLTKTLRILCRWGLHFLDPFPHGRHCELPSTPDQERENTLICEADLCTSPSESYELAQENVCPAIPMEFNESGM